MAHFTMFHSFSLLLRRHDEHLNRENPNFSNICWSGEGRFNRIIVYVYTYIKYIIFVFFKRRIDLYINHVYFVQGEQDRTEETSETKKTGGEAEEVAENLAHIYTYRSGLASH